MNGYPQGAGSRKMEDWRRDYNEERPHSAIGYKPPIALMNRSAGIGPP
jgi:putative transposase